MYPTYAKEAEDEGASEEVKEFYDGIEECQEHERGFVEKLEKLNKVFSGLSKVEEEHYNNYQNALNKVSGAGSFTESDKFLEGK